MTNGSEKADVKTTRRREFDAMGALVVVGLVFFHSAMIFGTLPFFPVRIVPGNQAVDVLVIFCALWGMPLMMLMAGSAIWYSLRKRSAGEFVRERVERLFIPLVFGVLVLIPPQIWTRMIHFDNAEFRRHYFDVGKYRLFLQRFFDVRVDLAKFPFVIQPDPAPLRTIDYGFEPMHLWFLVALLVYSLCLLPLFLYLRRAAGRRLIDRLGDGLNAYPWAIFALALPIGVIEAALETEGFGGWNRFAYVPILVYGFLFAAEPRFRDALARNWKSALILGLAVFIAVGGGIHTSDKAGIDPLTDDGLGSVLWRFLKGITGWFLIIAIVGLAGRGRQPRARQKGAAPGTNPDATRDAATIPGRGSYRETRRGPSLLDRVARSAPLRSGTLTQYAGDAQLPFYVLHQTVIVVIGFYVVKWEINAFLKYLFIVLSTVVVTLALYEVGVRRTPLTRFFFGVKPKREPQYADTTKRNWRSLARPIGLLVIFSALIAYALVSTFGGGSKTDTLKPTAMLASDIPDLDERIQRVENSLHPLTADDQPVSEETVAIPERMEHYYVPGVSIAVINDYQIEWAKGYGVLDTGSREPVTPDTLFQAAALSKPVVAAAALTFVERGLLDLDENVNDKLVSWQIPENEFTGEEKVTLRRLLSHSAGVTVHELDGYARGDEIPALQQILDGELPANNPPIRVEAIPGTEYRYSNGGYLIVQQLLMDVAGKPFPEIMQEAVLGPLGMTSSTYEMPLPKDRKELAATAHDFLALPTPGKWRDYPELAAGGLWSTPTDMARFLSYIAWTSSGGAPPSPLQELVKQMIAPQLETAQAQAYGLGFALGSLGADGPIGSLIWHDGYNPPGFRSYMLALPGSGKGLVIMTSGIKGHYLYTEILYSIAAEYE